MSNLDLTDPIDPISAIEVDGVEIPLAGSGGSNLDTQEFEKAIDDYSNLFVPYSGIYSRILEKNSWDTIGYISSEISANNYTAEQVAEIYGWNIGDTKEFQTLSGETCVARIIDFNHDIDEYNRVVGITFETRDVLAATYAMNDAANVTGGYAQCMFRTSNLPTIIDTMPLDLLRNAKLVKKLFADGDSKTATKIDYRYDKLFIPAAVEIGLGSDSNIYDYAGEGSTYKFYADGGSKVKQKYGIPENFAWFTRTATNGGSIMSSMKYYVSVTTSGGKGKTTPTTKAGICLMFCI